MKRIYTYYDPILNTKQDEILACMDACQKTWKYNGWEVLQLNKSHLSQIAGKIAAKVQKESLTWHPNLQAKIHQIKARFVRYAALEGARGGWMTDYDVVNFGFDEEQANILESQGELFTVGPGKGYLSYVSQGMVRAAINRILNSPLTRGEELIPEHELFGCSYFETNRVSHAAAPKFENKKLFRAKIKLKAKGKETLNYQN